MSRAAKRLRDYVALLSIRDLQSQRAEIRARKDNEAATRAQSKAAAAQKDSVEAHQSWLEALTLRHDPGIQQMWASHALSMQSVQQHAEADAEAAASAAILAKQEWAQTLRQVDIAQNVAQEARRKHALAQEEVRQVAQEDRNATRSRS